LHSAAGHLSPGSTALGGSHPATGGTFGSGGCLAAGHLHSAAGHFRTSGTTTRNFCSDSAAFNSGHLASGHPAAGGTFGCRHLASSYPCAGCATFGCRHFRTSGATTRNFCSDSAAFNSGHLASGHPAAGGTFGCRHLASSYPCAGCATFGCRHFRTNSPLGSKQLACCHGAAQGVPSYRRGRRTDHN
jgi:hypothetical protein